MPPSKIVWPPFAGPFDVPFDDPFDEPFVDIACAPFTFSKNCDCGET